MVKGQDYTRRLKASKKRIELFNKSHIEYICS